MSSQTISETGESINNVEVIDLTEETKLILNETINIAGTQEVPGPRRLAANETIVLDDSCVVEDSPIQLSSDNSEEVYFDDEKFLASNYPPDLSPAPLSPDSFTLKEHDNSTTSSPPSRLPSQLSLKRSSLESPASTPSPKLAKKNTPVGKSRKKSSPTADRITKAETKRLEKEAREEAKKVKQKEKELEKLVKETNRQNAANKALENCTANISTSILRLLNDTDEIAMKTLFDESMVRYILTDNLIIDNSLTWTYKRSEVLNGKCVSTFKDSEWLMVVMDGSDYLKKLLTYKITPNGSHSIKTYLNDVRKRSKMNVILLVFNLATHLKNERAKEAKNYRKAFKNRFEATSSTDTELVTLDEDDPIRVTSIGESELLDLRLALEMDLKTSNAGWKLHLEFYEKTSEAVQTIVRYTISIAKYEIKQKVRSSTGLDWAISTDKGRAVDPTKSEEDSKNLWIAQLQQFSQITLPIAKAIANEYPSPFALLDQYKNLTTFEAENLLAELYVQRNLKRQIGSNISKKIHCFMTCEDPDVHIGYS